MDRGKGGCPQAATHKVNEPTRAARAADLAETRRVSRTISSISPIALRDASRKDFSRSLERFGHFGIRPFVGVTPKMRSCINFDATNNARWQRW